jgi:hypothetical protein
MATWAEVQERVRAQFQLDREDEHEFSLTVPRQAEGARAQRVMVHHYTSWGREMIEFRSAFGEVEGTDLRALLDESLKLPIGGIAAHGRFLVVVHKECLEHLSIDGVLFLLTRVSLLADVLEERRGGDRF